MRSLELEQSWKVDDRWVEVNRPYSADEWCACGAA